MKPVRQLSDKNFVLHCLSFRQKVFNMATVLIADNEEKVKETLLQLLNGNGNVSLDVTRQENIVKIIKKEDASTAVTLKDKIIELGNYLYKEKTGRLHKTIMEIAEKPLIEYVLERVEGNQIKAAKILGLNRNTIRAKIAKLSINVNKWKAL